jgi:hypothetical protein
MRLQRETEHSLLPRSRLKTCGALPPRMLNYFTSWSLAIAETLHCLLQAQTWTVVVMKQQLIWCCVYVLAWLIFRIFISLINNSLRWLIGLLMTELFRVQNLCGRGQKLAYSYFRGHIEENVGTYLMFLMKLTVMWKIKLTDMAE